MTDGKLRVLSLAAAASLMVAACVPAAGMTPTAPKSPATGPLPVTEDITTPAYDVDQWPHWSVVTPGCDTRETALREQGADVVVNQDCRPLSGRWVSRYDGAPATDPAALDLDHLVPLADAHRSGGARWTKAQRKAFANDRANLVATTAAVNRAKSDRDPASWLPARDVCWYVDTWVTVKRRYQLATDPAEARAITDLQAHCTRLFVTSPAMPRKGGDR